MLKLRRWTLVVVAVWVLASILTPAAGMAGAGSGKIGTLMAYAPNHPNGCVPLQYDCFVIIVYPD